MNVAGDKCDECLPGFFGLSEENENGCTECFCSGLGTLCTQTQTQSINSTVCIHIYNGIRIHYNRGRRDVKFSMDFAVNC